MADYLVTDPLRRRKRHRARQEYGRAQLGGAARLLLGLMAVYIMAMAALAIWGAVKGT